MFEPIAKGEIPENEVSAPAEGEPPSRPPSRVLAQLEVGGRYRRLYAADISAVEVGVSVGGRARDFFHASAFVLGAMGSTNQGLEARFLSFGALLAFPLVRFGSGFQNRLTPAIRLGINVMDVARITRSNPMAGVGVGADAQLGVDLWQSGRHALYAVARAGIEGYLSDELEGLAITGYWMWGGTLGLGLRY